MNTVADVLNPDFARSWPEAVALVREIASVVGSASVPAPQDLLLDEGGRLTLGFASETSQDPVAGLAWILSGLLDGIDAPPQLRALAAENLGASPAHKSVEAFTSALAFFERPDRAKELQALARRLSGSARVIPDENDTELELQRLKEKVSGEPPAGTPPRPAKRPRLTRRQKAIAAAVGTAAASVAVVATQWSRLPSFSVSAIGAGQEQVSGLVSGGLRRLGFSSATAAAAPATSRALPAPKPSATTGTVVQKQPTQPDVRTRKGRDVLLPVRRDAGPVTSRPTTATANEMRFVGDVLTVAGLPIARLNPVRNDLTAMSVESIRPMEADGTPKVYSSADRQVEPARLVRPQLPREPAPGDETGYFVVTVDEQGTVEQVRLISPLHRYHDRMLVAAAKAWKFRPARLNGETVRYELRIPIILKGMP